MLLLVAVFVVLTGYTGYRLYTGYTGYWLYTGYVGCTGVTRK